MHKVWMMKALSCYMARDTHSLVSTIREAFLMYEPNLYKGEKLTGSQSTFRLTNLFYHNHDAKPIECVIGKLSHKEAVKSRLHPLFLHSAYLKLSFTKFITNNSSY